MNSENKYTCVQCLATKPRWEYQSYIRWEKAGDPIRYCCEDCWETLYNNTGKAWAKYMKMREKHITRTFGRAVWMTICPTRDVNINTLHKIIHKLMSGVLVKGKSWWVYEWRHNLSDWDDIEGVTADNDGLHVHAYVNVTNINSWKTKVKRMCTKYKWICNSGTVVPCTYPEQEKIDYVTGMTGNEDKNIKKSLDKLRREKYRIKHFFNAGNLPDSIRGVLTYQPTVAEHIKGHYPEHIVNAQNVVEF